MTTSVFSEFARSNDLDSAELDDIVNKAFDVLKSKYQQFEMSYDESGVTILNFDDCTNEETGGWTKEEVENDLTDELLKQANSSLNN